MPDFLQLGIKKEVNHTLKSLGLVTPTPIQEKTIPAVLDGKDIIAQAQTGTGKTLGFVLPILEKIDVNNTDSQALILTPTRELAIQITKEIKKMMENIDGVSVLAIFGGQDVQHQLKKLKGAQHIIVATPGRLLDHVRRGTVDLSTLSMLVIDEADQMLLMGFLPDVDTIINETFPSRQTLLFSATIPKEIHALANKYMKSPEHIEIKEKQVTVHKIKQYAVETTDRRKEGTLLHLIQEHQPYLAIIFCRTKARVEKLNATLKEKGFLSDELHGDIPQSKRQRAMKNFRDAKLQYLVATDVAARGLDVEGVTHVYNYDVPEDVETYIHRTGRTGRASGDGAAYTLFAPRDVDNLQLIEKGIKQNLERLVIKGISIPDREDYEKEREINIKKARKTAQKKKEFSASQKQEFNRRKR